MSQVNLNLQTLVMLSNKSRHDEFQQDLLDANAAIANLSKLHGAFSPLPILMHTHDLFGALCLPMIRTGTPR